MMFEKSLTSWLEIAQRSNWVIPHFNISTADMCEATIKTCAELKSPVIIGVSEGEADFLGYDFARLIIDFWKKKTDHPIFLNADHHHSLERAKTAIEAGFDSVNIDLSQKSEGENIAETKAVVEFSRKRHVNVEGEIGALPTQSSEIMKKNVKINPNTLTTPEQAKRFVDLTKVNRLTVAIGTLHGIEPSGRNPHIDIERLTEIAKVVRVPLTLHGGSGTPASDLKKALPYLSNIHINTDLRVAYSEKIKQEIYSTTTPYKYLTLANLALVKVVKEKIKLFGSGGKV